MLLRITPVTSPIQHIYVSPGRFSKVDQHHSFADKMGDVFVVLLVANEALVRYIRVAA